MRHSSDPRVDYRPVGETEYVMEQVRLGAGSGHALAAGILGSADLMRGAAIRPVLEAHIAAGQGRFRGIRARCAWDPDPEVGYADRAFYPRANVLVEGSFLEGARCLAELGLVLDIWAFHTQLGDVARFAAKCPELPIVIEHVGGPLGVGPYAGRRDEVFPNGPPACARLPPCPMSMSS